jgi:hypothetical protein
MTTLKPKTPCVISSSTKKYDLYGRPLHSAAKRRTKCAIIHLYREHEKTTVRADSSASRGRADEEVSQVRILLKPNEKISTGDLVEITLKGGQPITMEVRKIFRRPDVEGVIHHIDIEGDIWAPK